MTAANTVTRRALLSTAYPPSRSCAFVQAASSVLNTSNFLVFFKVQVGVTSSRKPSLAILPLVFPGSPPPASRPVHWRPEHHRPYHRFLLLCLHWWTAGLNTGNRSCVFKFLRNCGSIWHIVGMQKVVGWMNEPVTEWIWRTITVGKSSFVIRFFFKEFKVFHWGDRAQNTVHPNEGAKTAEGTGVWECAQSIKKGRSQKLSAE